MLGDGRQSREVHGSPPTYLEWTIIVYVIGRQHLYDGFGYFIYRQKDFYGTKRGVVR